jgi:hypothetical protein
MPDAEARLAWRGRTVPRKKTEMTSPIQVTEDGTEDARPEDDLARGKAKQDEIKPGLWKLLVAAGCILVVVFVTMELVDDTYLSPTESMSGMTTEHGHS